MGDFLIVSVVPDRFVTKTGRPIYKEDERLALLNAIRHVSRAELCLEAGPQRMIRHYLPDLYVRGSDYIGIKKPEDEVLREMGIPIRYTKSIPPTTTEILERMQCALHSS